MKMIEINELWKKFSRFDALRGLSVHVDEGSACMLIGANGSGKTTTIKTLTNLIEPDRGSVSVMGVSSRQLAAADYAKIGYVAENQELPERLTVGQFLAYLRPFYPSWDKELETEILGQAPLPMRRRIGALSHGMRVKLALICALSFRPRLLVFDEPFSGLDPLARDEFMDILLRHLGQTTLLMSSHELDEVEAVATHVAFIDRGRLLFQESMADLSARVREVHVSNEGDAVLPPRLPPEWLDVKVLSGAISFIETKFDEVGLESKICAALGAARRIVAVRPVQLRSIFAAIARSIRHEALI